MAQSKWIFPLKMVDLSIVMLNYQRVCEVYIYTLRIGPIKTSGVSVPRRQWLYARGAHGSAAAALQGVAVFGFPSLGQG